MKRTFLILCAAMLFPIFAGAQSHKIGIVDSQKVLSEMPEMKSMQSELDNLAKKYEDTLVQLQKEFQTKYQDFVKEQETMVESIKSRKQQELEDLSKRIQDLNNVAQQDMQKKQVELFAPIQTKLREAINKVGNDGGFTYIMDSSQMLYVGNGSEDVTSLVKSKLGL
ncbi:MAG: OmpH family outer membrane protein [Porphyromonas sp.]|uniref:OmpH family outer membrane protein n=1 Tax=Porphyromonas sp. TaxID=1924944 RepID=UPI0025967175|nr:OmpH family outer membrane protein [Porphyromonas sp.]MDD7468932.1 OmpH family outer membrane protein [Bacteroidales bacterium]MDY6101735.1 OmpH family outer membrane protein [Porphyromonas sp.]